MLTGTTELPSDQVLTMLKEAAGGVKGGGASLLTSGLWNIGAQVKLVGESDSTLRFALNSGKDLIELCTFSAKVSEDAGRTTVRVGGLETYKTSQQKLYGFIPSGPKFIAGMAPYKRFLEAAQSQIQAHDAAASLSIAQAEHE